MPQEAHHVSTTLSDPRFHLRRPLGPGRVPLMATIGRTNGTYHLKVAGEVILSADSLSEINAWLSILGMTASVVFVS